MSILYFQCENGAAGDMIGAALLGLVADRQEMKKRLNEAGIPGVTLLPSISRKNGLEGLSMTVRIQGKTEEEACHHSHHSHMTMEEIRQIVEGLKVSDWVKKAVMDIYQILAEAESKAHGCPVEEVHFHEVGALDAIADVTAACMLVEELGPEQILASPLQVGSGTIRCAHGILPVPAPATAHILEGIPYSPGEFDGEICTPTGAAILTYFAQAFGQKMPAGPRRESIGLGKRSFGWPSYFKAALIG